MQTTIDALFFRLPKPLGMRSSANFEHSQALGSSTTSALDVSSPSRRTEHIGQRISRWHSRSMHGQQKMWRHAHSHGGPWALCMKRATPSSVLCTSLNSFKHTAQSPVRRTSCALRAAAVCSNILFFVGGRPRPRGCWSAGAVLEVVEEGRSEHGGIMMCHAKNSNTALQACGWQQTACMKKRNQSRRIPQRSRIIRLSRGALIRVHFSRNQLAQQWKKSQLMM